MKCGSIPALSFLHVIETIDSSFTSLEERFKKNTCMDLTVERLYLLFSTNKISSSCYLISFLDGCNLTTKLSSVIVDGITNGGAKSTEIFKNNNLIWWFKVWWYSAKPICSTRTCISYGNVILAIFSISNLIFYGNSNFIFTGCL